VQIPVEAEATNIPNGVDVDVTDMEVGAAVHAKDLVLPEGSTLQIDPEALVLHVLAERTQEQIEAELGEGAAEAGDEAEVPEPVAPAEAPERE
jgi:large subunit ribosomal protein L25